LRVNELTPGGQDNFKIADEGGLIADGVLHRTAETSLSMTSSNYQNSNADLQPVPVLTMQRNSAYMGPNLDSFGHMGQLNQTHNACVPLKNDFVVLAYGAREPRSEEQGLKFELAYGEWRPRTKTADDFIARHGSAPSGS
jgi:hypothetical protein